MELGEDELGGEALLGVGGGGAGGLEGGEGGGPEALEGVHGAHGVLGDVVVREVLHEDAGRVLGPGGPGQGQDPGGLEAGLVRLLDGVDWTEQELAQVLADVGLEGLAEATSPPLVGRVARSKVEGVGVSSRTPEPTHGRLGHIGRRPRGATGLRLDGRDVHAEGGDHDALLPIVGAEQGRGEGRDPASGPAVPHVPAQRRRRSRGVHSHLVAAERGQELHESVVVDLRGGSSLELSEGPARRDGGPGGAAGLLAAEGSESCRSGSSRGCLALRSLDRVGPVRCLPEPPRGAET